AALAVLALVLAAAGLAGTVAAYQRSFFEADPPAFPGISADAPFLCGMGRADARIFPGPEVFDSLLARVAATEPPTPPEEGMLALAQRDPDRAARFRASLLAEAARGEFSRLGQTKYWQYEAAQRAYWYPRVRAAFPALFPPEDVARFSAWFASINRRALAHGP